MILLCKLLQIIDAFSRLQEYHDEKNYFVENTDVDYTIKQHLISYMLKNISVQKKLIHKNIFLIQIKNRRTIFSSPAIFYIFEFWDSTNLIYFTSANL